MGNALTEKSLVLAVVVAFCLIVLSGCELLETIAEAPKPSARITGVALQDITLSSATLAFDVDVLNPYSVPLPLTNLDYALASRGKQFLDGTAKLQGTVPARGSKKVPLLAKMDYKGMLGVLQDVRPGAVIPYDAELGLSVDAPTGSIRLPLRKEGRLPIPAAPEVQSMDVSWKEMSLKKASGILKLKLVNRNDFSVDLTKLLYSLSIGKTEIAKSSVERPTSFQAGGGTGIIEIPLELIPSNLGLAVFGMLKGKEPAFDLKGTLDTKTPFGPMSLPINRK